MDVTSEAIQKKVGVYQVEYRAYGLSGCKVEVERETLEEAKKLADKLRGYLCHEAKVRDVVTQEIVYDTEDRGIE